MQTTQTTTPKIYVACLAAYNNGFLHGQWIDANQETEAIHAGTKPCRRRGRMGDPRL